MFWFLTFYFTFGVIRNTNTTILLCPACTLDFYTRVLFNQKIILSEFIYYYWPSTLHSVNLDETLILLTELLTSNVGVNFQFLYRFLYFSLKQLYLSISCTFHVIIFLVFFNCCLNWFPSIVWSLSKVCAAKSLFTGDRCW